ncbi:MAG: tRNA (adenosine(37)-N6)-threonylcarbamoyltransferase complex dimerization subunit type 1 TsaB, partial [Lentisphaerae bacterium]|nr:tRNA (adenosine(37)-N6)-threonylcarbamoyltransferase complex dimerization subunit type 1 TsaB [Lentisphaerota bacterium]
MKILAIEQSTPRGSAALLLDSEVIDQRAWTDERLRSQGLFTVVRELLAAASCDVGDIDLFAVDTGPGGFSSLRISVAAVRGLALPLDKPVLGITSGEILAAQTAGEEGVSRVTVFGDARRDRLWWGEFAVDGTDVQTLVPYALIPREDAADAMSPGACAVTADWDRVGKTLLESAPTGTPIVQESRFPTAATLGKIAAHKPNAATTNPRDILSPVY